MSTLGRISGPLLADNLTRSNQDLAFQTSLLYLDVTGRNIGINTASPVYNFDSPGNAISIGVQVDGQANFDNVIINAAGYFSTVVGPLHIVPTAIDPVIFHNRLTTSALLITNNLISSISNNNIRLDPHGSGTIELETVTTVTGDLSISGNVLMDGDLRSDGTVTVGDNILDTVTIAPDFAQGINPGQTNMYDLGTTTKKWDKIYGNVLDTVNPINPWDIIVSDQLHINTIDNKISGIQSNEDLIINPASGITYLERIKWQENTITNLDNTALTIITIDDGYVTFGGSTALVIPYGTSAERPTSPEIGTTRWNTELQILETFDGATFLLSNGGAAVVYEDDMIYMSSAWVLMVG